MISLPWRYTCCRGIPASVGPNLSLGRFLLSGIRPGRKGEPRIEVEFSIDSDEILQVRARDVDTGAGTMLPSRRSSIRSTEANTDGCRRSLPGFRLSPLRRGRPIAAG
jgi:molecular chaperone DnaK (HSP70)